MLIGLALVAIVLKIRVLVQWVSVSVSVDDESCGGSDHPRRQFLSNSSLKRYVSLCHDRMYGDHRLGNHLFILAAMLLVAEQTNRSIMMKAEGWCLDEVFELNSVLRYRDKNSPLPGRSRIMEPHSRYPQSFDDRLSVVNGTSQVQTYADFTSNCNIDGNTLPIVISCRDLGVVVTHNLFPSTHIDAVVNKAHQFLFGGMKKPQFTHGLTFRYYCVHYNV